MDEDVYSIEKVSYVNTSLTSFTPSWSDWKNSALHVVTKRLTKPLHIVLMLLTVVLAVESSAFTRIMGAVIWIGSLSLLTALHLFVKLQTHVTEPVFCAAFLGTLLISVCVRTTKGAAIVPAESEDVLTGTNCSEVSLVRSRVATIVLIGAACLSAYLVSDYYSYSKKGPRLRRPFLRLVDKLERA